jgi:hypothetical protein
MKQRSAVIVASFVYKIIVEVAKTVNRKDIYMQENTSDIALFRQHIELECEALQLIFRGYAVVAQHEVIQRKYQAINEYVDQLATLIGSEQATHMAIDIYTQVVK